jgi:hypothetical protein
MMPLPVYVDRNHCYNRGGVRWNTFELCYIRDSFFPFLLSFLLIETGILRRHMSVIVQSSPDDGVSFPIDWCGCEVLCMPYLLPVSL